MSILHWNESHKYGGRWWSETSPENVFQGKLYFEESIPKIKLAGKPEDNNMQILLGGTPVAHGILSSGEKVTLWDSRKSPVYEFTTPKGQRKSGRTFQTAILGAHVPGLPDQPIKSIEVRLRGLMPFTDRRTEMLDASSNNAEMDRDAAQYQLTLGSDEYVFQAQVLGARQLLRDNLSDSGVYGPGAGDRLRITFSCSTSAAIDVYSHVLYDFQNLLGLACQAVVPVESEKWRIEGIPELLSVVRATKDSDAKRGHRTPIYRKNLLFTLDEIDLASLLQKWRAVVQTLYPATEVLGMGNAGYLEASTMSIIAVAEKIQPLVCESAKPLSDKTYDRYRTEIKGKFSGDVELRSYLLQEVRNSPTFHLRMEALITSLTEKRLKSMLIDPSDWVSRTKCVRNRLAHDGTHVKRRDQEGAIESLGIVNLETRAIVSLLILQFMDFDDGLLDSAAKILAWRFERLLGRNETNFPSSKIPT